MIYLDHQASTPALPGALAAVLESCQEHFANPHSESHAAGWAAAAAVEHARARVAMALGAEPEELVFTSGATEANNMALLGACAEPGSRDGVVVSAVEHEAILAPADELQRRGMRKTTIPVDRSGAVDVDAFACLVDERTLIASVMLVSNEVGTVQPIRELAAICAKSGILFHVDAAQALAWHPIDVIDLGVDLLSVSAHKMGGPKGVGALYVSNRARSRIRPVMHGGGQQGGLRPGTSPTPLCAGFAAACDELPDAAEVARWRNRTRRFAEKLSRLASDSRLNGRRDGHPGNVSLTLPGIDADLLVNRLQPRVSIARGSACTSGAASPSHVLLAMGLSAAECASTVRISTAAATTEAELDTAALAIAEEVAEIRSLGAI